MKNYFAKNLRYIREKKNISQEKMASDLGIGNSTLSCWENGYRTPDLNMIAKITEYLNIKKNFITEDLTKYNIFEITKNENDLLKENEIIISKIQQLDDEDKNKVISYIDFLLNNKDD